MKMSERIRAFLKSNRDLWLEREHCLKISAEDAKELRGEMGGPGWILIKGMKYIDIRTGEEAPRPKGIHLFGMFVMEDVSLCPGEMIFAPLEYEE